MPQESRLTGDNRHQPENLLGQYSPYSCHACDIMNAACNIAVAVRALHCGAVRLKALWHMCT